MNIFYVLYILSLKYVLRYLFPSKCCMPAGYDLSLEEGFEELLEDFEKIIGWQFLRGLHINDSKGVHVCFYFLFSKYFSELVN